MKNQTEIATIKAALETSICSVDGDIESFVYALLEKAADIASDHKFFDGACSEVGWTYLLPKLTASSRNKLEATICNVDGDQ